MRKLFLGTAAIAVAFALLIPIPVAAQAAYTSVQSLDVAPEDAETLLSQMKLVREGAEEIGLDARFRWDVYRWDNEILFVSWHESLAELEDEGAMFRAFQGTAAGERIMAAFEENGDMDIDGENSIVRSRPELGYVPANSAVAAGEHGGLYVIQMWPKTGKNQELEESIKGFMSLIEESGGVYPIRVNQDVIGDGGYSVIVVFDNLSNFYGENALETRLAQNPAIARRFQAAGEAHSKLIKRSESRLVNYLPEHSYRPDLATASAGGN